MVLIYQLCAVHTAVAYQLLIQSGKVIETYNYSGDLPKKHEKRSKRVAKIRGNTSESWGNQQRKAKMVKRLVWANLGREGNPAFLSFTLVADCSVHATWQAFSMFIKRARRVYGKEFRYIAVKETQKRGVPHIHALFWGLPEQTVKNERNYRTIQNLFAYGFVDCIPTDGNAKLAGYISKYITKEFGNSQMDNAEGGSWEAAPRSYMVSRNCRRPVRVPFASAFAFLDEITDTSKVAHTKVFKTAWLGMCEYKLYGL